MVKGCGNHHTNIPWDTVLTKEASGRCMWLVRLAGQWEARPGWAGSGPRTVRNPCRESNSTLKGSYTMIKWGLSQECKDSSIYANQSM